MMKIDNNVWSTPVIPKAASKISGVENCEICLNDPSGNGTWKFLYDIPDAVTNEVPLPAEEVQDFDFSGWADRNWQNIKVPGELVMQGFDILSNNEYYYQREITVPEDFAGNRILLRFDGVYSNARVWINGKYIRSHVGGFTTWDCDITPYVKPGGKAVLTVGVADLYSETKGIWNPEGKPVNNPSNASVYAHHNIGGINRDVSLVAMPFDFIARTYINTVFDETFTDADLEVMVQLGLQSDDAEVKIELFDENSLVVEKKLVFAKDDASQSITEGLKLSKAQEISIPVASPKKWDAEHPNLYKLRLTLLAGTKVIQVNEENVGFREIYYGGYKGSDKNKLYVNGKEVKLRGTCRHDVSDDLGRSMTKEEFEAEVLAYKNANINFIRTSHYPGAEELLDLCDKMGIYVEQESAVCFQGTATDVYSRYEDFMTQFTEMIERDRNHPCILIWSLGNESNYAKVAEQSGGNAFLDEKKYLKNTDTSRPCIFSWMETGEPDDLIDICSRHYDSVEGEMGNRSMPTLHEEYAHIPCYNLDELQRDMNTRNFWGESIKKAWENIFTTDGALGGALWGGIDDVFYIPEGTTKRWLSHSDGPAAGYGEWGCVLDAYLREKPEAYLTKKAYSPIRVQEEKCYVKDETMYIPVKNWFDHTDMNEIQVEYTVDGQSKRIQIGESILPHSEGIITIKGIEKDAEKVNLKFYTADKVMIDEYNVPLVKSEYLFAEESDVPPVIKDCADEITVSGECFSIAFHKTTGLISRGIYGKDTVLLTGGPYLHVTGANFGDWIPDEKDGITAEICGKYAVVVLKGQYTNGQGVRFDIKISGNGIISVDYLLTTIPGKESGYEEVGVRFGISDDMTSVSWDRKGLYSAYPEDHIGRNTGEALKVRPGAEKTPDRYGVVPKWPWKDDMKNYFIYESNNPNDGLVTNDFKTMRENVCYYDVKYGKEEYAPRITVESEKADVAVRVNTSYAMYSCYIDDRSDRIKYTGEWKTIEAGSAYDGTETYSTQKGDSCELTFEGCGIRFIGAKQENTGKAKVYIDGVFRTEINTYSNLGNDLKQTAVFTIEGLDNGSHTIKLETAGGNANCIVVDAFEILRQKDDTAKKESSLIINNQWYYPNLAWGNYLGIPGSISESTKGSVTIRLTDKRNFRKVIKP